MSLPRFDIIDREVAFKADGMCVHSAEVDFLEVQFVRILGLLNAWHEAFGAECYNDALIALNAETEKVLQASTEGLTAERTGNQSTPPAR